MNNPLELLKKTELTLFSLAPKEARQLKAKTIILINSLAEKERLPLIHQISQERQWRGQENFLNWLECYCDCAECEED